jgi:hypothetical protein
MPIDPNKIFGLFGGKEELNSKEPVNQANPLAIDFNDPFIKLKMFKKLIMNQTSYSKGLIEMFKKVDPKLDISEIERAGEAMLYGRAYGYIDGLDLKDKKVKKIITLNVDEELKISLKLSLKYFEEIEEYEKCAFLKNLLDLFLK